MRTPVTTATWMIAVLLLAAGGQAAAAPSDCTSYEDHTAPGASRTLPWVLSISGNPARCMKILVGQTVTWAGSFSSHPLINDGGDTPNPIAGHDASGNVTFTKAGTFGYLCSVHATMTGAIQVVAPVTPVPASGTVLRVALLALLLASALLLLRRARRAS